MKCQRNPNKAFIQNHKHCESVSKGPVGEEGGTRDGRRVPATGWELHCSFLLRGPTRPPYSGAAKGALASTSFPLDPLSKGDKPKRALASKYTHRHGPSRARTPPSRHTTQHTDARAAALSAPPTRRRGESSESQTPVSRRPGPPHPHPIPLDSLSPGGSAQADPQQWRLVWCSWGWRGVYREGSTHSPAGPGLC